MPTALRSANRRRARAAATVLWVGHLVWIAPLVAVALHFLVPLYQRISRLLQAPSTCNQLVHSARAIRSNQRTVSAFS